MTDWQNFSAETRAAVAALSRGSCYFPGCRTPILVFLDGQPMVNVEITHIRAGEPGRPRYVPGVRRETVDSFENLLLLCVPHRKTVDRDEKTHPIDLLETWKPHRAAGPRDALTALGDLTADQLDELLTTAFSAIQDQITEALSRFEKADPDSAHLLRTLLRDLREQRRSGADPDTAATPALTRQVTALEDRAARLLKAADQLQAASSRLEGLVAKPETPATRTNIGWTSGAG